MKSANLKKFFYKKKVIVTGHTGFKGSWLTFWLKNMGANVMGISNNQKTQPSVFQTLSIKKKIIHKNQNIKDLKKLKKYLAGISLIMFFI